LRVVRARGQEIVSLGRQELVEMADDQFANADVDVDLLAIPGRTGARRIRCD